MTLSAADIQAIVGGAHGDPFAVLGPHPVRIGDGCADAVRVILGAPAPHAQTMERIHPDGLFEAVFADQPEPFPYRLEVAGHQGQVVEIEDPYRFPSTLADYDLRLLGEGTHYRADEKLGAHPRVMEGVSGVTVAVWESPSLPAWRRAPSRRRIPRQPSRPRPCP